MWKKERKNKTDEVEDQMRGPQSNRNTTQAAHTSWNDIDDGVHTCDAYVYFEDVGLSPPGAQHNLIDWVKASVISSGKSAELWCKRLPWWFIPLQKDSQQCNCVRWNDACNTSKSRRKLTWNSQREKHALTLETCAWQPRLLFACAAVQLLTLRKNPQRVGPHTASSHTSDDQL